MGLDRLLNCVGKILAAPACLGLVVRPGHLPLGCNLVNFFCVTVRTEQAKYLAGSIHSRFLVLLDLFFRIDKTLDSVIIYLLALL